MALVVDELTVHFDRMPVLWDLSFTIEKGSLVGIMGPNGAGKSTLLQTILGQKKAVSGSIRLFGKTIDQMRRNIAYVPQKSQVDWTFPATVLDVVLMGRYHKLGLFRFSSKADKIAAKMNIEKVGLQGLEKRQINELSEGQKQRVFFARALMHDADIFFLDEPFAGVDMATEEKLMDLLKREKKEGKTILIVHHDLTTAQNYFDTGILLNMGLISSGDIDQVLTQENINKAFGKAKVLLQDATKEAQKKSVGAL